jgi:large subunit ribosomal protein L17
MRHRRQGRKLGRDSAHRKALLRNLACSLFRTEIHEPDERGAPKVSGRIVTTVAKAKEVQPVVERLITLACRSFEHQRRAEQYATGADRGTEAWAEWRQSPRWQQWNQAVAPAIEARRRAFSVLRDLDAVEALFEHVAPRFENRPGGYTRVLRLSKRRLGDAGETAILEFVGRHDRVSTRRERPAIAPQAAPRADTPKPASEAPEPEASPLDEAAQSEENPQQ